MRKGTTPFFECELPFNVGLVKTAKLTISQKDNILIEKYKDDFEIIDNVLRYRMSQEETFLFENNSEAKAQLRVLTMNDEAFSTDPLVFRVFTCLDNEVLK